MKLNSGQSLTFDWTSQFVISFWKWWPSDFFSDLLQYINIHPIKRAVFQKSANIINKNMQEISLNERFFLLIFVAHYRYHAIYNVNNKQQYSASYNWTEHAMTKPWRNNSCSMWSMIDCIMSYQSDLCSESNLKSK